MNKRIRELITQAGGYWNHGDFGLGSSVEFQENDIKLFVELIVKECASICEIEGRSYEYSFTPAKAKLAESTSNHCSKMIQKHFGVE